MVDFPFTDVHEAPSEAEVARSRRNLLLRLVAIAIVTWVLPALYIAYLIVDGQMPTVTLLIYPAMAAVVGLMVHSGNKAVTETREFRPDAYFVWRALDPSVRPSGWRLLIADPSGLTLASGTCADLKRAWHLPWADLTGAEVAMAKFKGAWQPALLIRMTSGQVRTLRLRENMRVLNIEYSSGPAESAARTVNDQVQNRHAIDNGA